MKTILQKKIENIKKNVLLTLVCRETLLMNRKVRVIYWSRSWPDVEPLTRIVRKICAKKNGETRRIEKKKKKIIVFLL